MNPLVSVIIPSYKRPALFVERAIKSVLAQTYAPLELIVVDDNPPGSPERAAMEMLMRGYAQDERVCYVRNARNMGGSLARNEGIAVAKGEFLAFLDDDDEYLPEKLSVQIPFMQAQGCDMSLTDWKLYNDAGKLIDYRTFSDIPAFDRETLLKYHLMHHMTGTGTFVYRAEKLREIGGFEPAIMGQEFYLMLRTIERGLKVAYMPGCYIVAHQHDCGRISQGAHKVKGEDLLYAFKQRYFDRLTPRERRFVRFRHWAVLTVVYLRDRRYAQMLGAAVRMVISSPGDTAQQGLRFARKLLRGRGKDREDMRGAAPKTP